MHNRVQKMPFRYFTVEAHKDVKCTTANDARGDHNILGEGVDGGSQ